MPHASLSFASHYRVLYIKHQAGDYPERISSEVRARLVLAKRLCPSLAILSAYAYAFLSPCEQAMLIAGSGESSTGNCPLVGGDITIALAGTDYSSKVAPVL